MVIHFKMNFQAFVWVFSRREDKFNWGLNLVKVKDNISSVRSNVKGAIINLDAITNQFSI